MGTPRQITTQISIQYNRYLLDVTVKYKKGVEF